MFEIHQIIESWLLQGTERQLSAFKRRLCQAHLKSCGQCRSFALDLVQFSHGLEERPTLSQPERAMLHATVMAAFQRERFAERIRVSAPSFRRADGSFLSPAVLRFASVMLLIAALFWYGARPASIQDEGSTATSSLVPRIVHEIVATPSPTVIPTPKAVPQASPVPNKN